MNPSSIYDQNFFDRQQSGSRLSASVIVPIILKLVHIKSVVDIGCGLGTWLSVFLDCGIEDVVGIDGDYIDRNKLQISRDNFIAFDLSKSIEINRTFDIALCLEVAEHLEPENAAVLIQSLAKLAPIILFSAAVPFQGGVNHFNEQWLEYWVELFAVHDLLPVDAIRKHIWKDQKVEFWYRQNTILFCHQQIISNNVTLNREFSETNTNMLSVVHPNLHLRDWRIVQSLGTSYLHGRLIDRTKKE